MTLSKLPRKEKRRLNRKRLEITSGGQGQPSCGRGPIGRTKTAPREEEVIYKDRADELNEFERSMIPPREIITLYDYRTHISLWHTDHDLLLTHQSFPRYSLGQCRRLIRRAMSRALISIGTLRRP